MLCDESKNKFIEICMKAWDDYVKITGMNVKNMDGFRGGQVTFISTAIGHLKKDGNISMWEISSLDIKHNFKYDV